MNIETQEEMMSELNRKIQRMSARDFGINIMDLFDEITKSGWEEEGYSMEDMQAIMMFIDCR